VQRWQQTCSVQGDTHCLYKRPAVSTSMPMALGDTSAAPDGANSESAAYRGHTLPLQTKPEGTRQFDETVGSLDRLKTKGDGDLPIAHFRISTSSSWQGWKCQHAVQGERVEIVSWELQFANDKSGPWRTVENFSLTESKEQVPKSTLWEQETAPPEGQAGLCTRWPRHWPSLVGALPRMPPPPWPVASERCVYLQAAGQAPHFRIVHTHARSGLNKCDGVEMTGDWIPAVKPVA
jgi:hypothetical protein